MSADIVSFIRTDGIITLKISGKLTQPELATVQKTALGILRQHGNMRMLVLADDFQGWDRGGDWGDLSFFDENDKYLEKIAIVGDKKWEDLVLIFAGKGLRRCLVEYFQPEEAAKAQAWLMENT